MGFAHLGCPGGDLVEEIDQEGAEAAGFLFVRESGQIDAFPDPIGFRGYDTPGLGHEVVEGGLVAEGGSLDGLDLLEAQEVFICVEGQYGYGLRGV